MKISLPLLALQGACYTAGYFAMGLLARGPLRVLTEHAASEDMDVPYGEQGVAIEAERFLAALERPIPDQMATALLMQFCEWLDDGEAGRDEDAETVRAFGDFRRSIPDAWPKIST